MATSVVCPRCDTTFRPVKGWKGGRISCPKCNSTFRIPPDDEPTSDAEEEPLSDQSQRKRGRKQRASTHDRPEKKKPVGIGLLVSAGLFGLLLAVSLGRYTVPLLLLGIEAGIMLVMWFVILADERKAQAQTALLVSLGAAGGTFLAGWGLSYLIVRINRENYLESTGLRAKVPDYIAAGQKREMLAPVLLGKVVILENEGAPGYRFNYLHHTLPEALKPYSDEEVGTVILIDWSKQAVGRYTNGATAYRWFAGTRLIDYRHKTNFYSTTIAGSPPSQSVRAGESTEGDRPFNDIEKWILDLPHQELGSRPPAIGAPPPQLPGGKPFVKPKTPPLATKYKDLVAYWSFDEAGGTKLIDHSGNRLEGTMHGGKRVPGIRGQALEFDGTSEFFDLGISKALDFAADAPFTAAVWVKTTERNGTIVSFRNAKDDGALIDILLSMKNVVVQVRHDRAISAPTEVRSSSELSPGEWQHIALTREPGGNVELFLDGASMGKKQGPASKGSITTNLRCLGFERYWQQTNFMPRDIARRRLQGAVDEFCVFSRVLSATEIRELAGRDR